MQTTTDPLALVRGMFADLIEAGRNDEASIRRYMSDDYRQCVDGRELDLASFQAHLLKQREVVEKMQVEFLAVAQDGDSVLTHHLVRVFKKNGDTPLFQVLAHFSIRDGRIAACDELTRQLEGHAADSDLGSRH
ncbi:nuclear transport factor 2 family protein [Chromobacterium sp. IIBBL 290-4]|uniref:nuclear transport factor 2 family protein n=1 Tax=Chromobacterium sp. IIBBL 290-4 TaxID=2953890 RepID=UPI0020B81718|nr:nuclear transport factor 2 family protein [Chromobacterium sp. IIBBL 290-4]UTH72385.1 nuclear transport factor 2 family protein [Chromobacterium sp. IIBBL 290-4]